VRREEADNRDCGDQGRGHDQRKQVVGGIPFDGEVVADVWVGIWAAVVPSDSGIGKVIDIFTI
jgi:hypothetical protein